MHVRWWYFISPWMDNRPIVVCCFSVILLLRECCPLPSLPRWLAIRAVPECGRGPAHRPVFEHGPDDFLPNPGKTQVVKPAFSSPHPDAVVNPSRHSLNFRVTFSTSKWVPFHIFNIYNNFEFIKIHALCEIWLSTVGSIVRYSSELRHTISTTLHQQLFSIFLINLSLYLIFLLM